MWISLSTNSLRFLWVSETWCCGFPEFFLNNCRNCKKTVTRINFSYFLFCQKHLWNFIFKTGKESCAWKKLEGIFFIIQFEKINKKKVLASLFFGPMLHSHSGDFLKVQGSVLVYSRWVNLSTVAWISLNRIWNLK